MPRRVSTVRGRELGDGLRLIVDRSKFTGRGLALLLGWDHQKLSDLLNGKLGVTEVELASLLGALHTPVDERDHLLALFREVNIRGWLPIKLRTLINHENAATSITNWQLSLIPGLLQIPDYMRAVITADPTMPAKEIEDRVEARIARQEILSCGTSCTFYVHEHALHLPVGSPEIMSEQLHHLLRMSVRPNIILRIVRTDIGAPPGLNGSFVVLKFDGIEPVVHVETQTSGLFIEEKEAVEAYDNLVTSLDAVALDREGSRRLITGIVG